MLDAVRANGLTLQYADIAVGNSKEVVLAAVSQNGDAIQYAGILSNDGEILIASTRQLGHLIPGKTRIYMNLLNIEYLRKDTSVYSGINSSNDEVINDVVLNRIMLRADGRPMAMIVFPKEDWNRAFRPDSTWGNSYDFVKQLKEKGYRVLYYEARTENDLYNAIREGGVTQKISVLLMAGHGHPGGIGFGGNYREINEIGFNDMIEIRELAEYMAEGCVVILDSCSTGAGRNNIARRLGDSLPGCRIFAPKYDCSGFGFRYDENNRVIGAAHCCRIALPGDTWQFSCEERFTTVINP
jgi:hypothetical protein